MRKLKDKYKKINYCVFLCYIFVFVLLFGQMVQAKSIIDNYETCYLNACGEIRQIKSISIKGDKLIVVGTMKKNNKILKEKKRVFKISKKAKFYYAEDISLYNMSRKELKEICGSISKSLNRAFDIQVKNGKIVKIVYYP